MTRFEDEEWKVSSPDQRKLNVFDVDGVKVGISICFDVEFRISHANSLYLESLF